MGACAANLHNNQGKYHIEWGNILAYVPQGMSRLASKLQLQTYLYLALANCNRLLDLAGLSVDLAALSVGTIDDLRFDCVSQKSTYKYQLVSLP